VPVPDPGVPREWVDAAREAIKGNCRPLSPTGGFRNSPAVFFIAGVAAT
jgi:hypothetical protein